MKYKTIVIDPPWDISNGYKMSEGTPLKDKIPYDTMSIDEIKQFPINDYSDKECDLFLWVTHSTLPKAFEILDVWGFKYHCLITWDKEQGLTMYGFHRRTEYVIYAYRGKMGVNQIGKSFPTLIRERKTKHSAKPDSFYNLVVKLTREPRIDIFARKKHFGFDSFGNQAENPTNLEVFCN